MEKSKNKLLSLTTTRVLLALRVKSRVLRNPRLLLKEKILRLPHRHTPSPPLFLQGTREKWDEVDDSGTSKTGAPPAEEVVPTEERTTFNPYEDALVSS